MELVSCYTSFRGVQGLNMGVPGRFHGNLNKYFGKGKKCPKCGRKLNEATLKIFILKFIRKQCPHCGHKLPYKRK